MAQQKVGLSHFRNTDGFGADVTKTRSQMSQSSDKNEEKLKSLISKWKILGELEKQNSNTDLKNEKNYSIFQTAPSQKVQKTVLPQP